MDAERFDIHSLDGTRIAVWVHGTGPAIVMVHGSIADHTTFDPLVAVLGEQMTTYAMDRRGFGASGDTPDYSIERDFDDVAAGAIPDAEIRVLEGHGHFAHRTDPGLVTKIVVDFATSRTTRREHVSPRGIGRDSRRASEKTS